MWKHWKCGIILAWQPRIGLSFVDVSRWAFCTKSFFVLHRCERVRARMKACHNRPHRISRSWHEIQVSFIVFLSPSLSLPLSSFAFSFSFFFSFRSVCEHHFKLLYFCCCYYCVRWAFELTEWVSIRCWMQLKRKCLHLTSNRVFIWFYGCQCEKLCTN